MDAINSNLFVEAAAAGARTALRYGPEPLARGVDFLESLARAGGISGSAIGGETRDLLDQQIELQKEMLQVTLFSNIERTKHETEMAPARNLRLA